MYNTLMVQEVERFKTSIRIIRFLKWLQYLIYLINSVTVFSTSNSTKQKGTVSAYLVFQ